MTKPKITKVKDNKSTAERLNEVQTQPSKTEAEAKSIAQTNAENAQTDDAASVAKSWQEEQDEINKKYELERSDVSEGVSNLFERWEAGVFEPQDFETRIPSISLEACIGYSSLYRQMHHAFVNKVAYYCSEAGGSLSIDDARANAFHACTDTEEAKKEFNMLLGQRVENLNFVDLLELHNFTPRVAERLWENYKQEGRKEFESGHLAANINLPVDYMKGLWNVARYLGVRESFIDDWNPRGGIEVALIDMMAQSWFQWQFWLEQTVKRSQTREKELHPECSRWLAQRNRELKSFGVIDGYWNRPLVSEQQAVEHAVQMADRFNRIFMRTLRQLRDLRRYAPVTINNPNQVNIASDGGQQVNVSNADEEKTKKVTS